ncbi:thiamine phosphate synthase [Methyloglobulus sp.]|uniref:thiamine phosphate synthase n=1 Tax=Methyloglobulus sp. TaxID=2518622 RepID=UPI003988E9AC
MKAFPARGLYAITQTQNNQTKHKSAAVLFEEVVAIIRGGAVVIQYRDKNPANALFVARELVKVCQHHDVPLIINDDVELAILSKADGVHLGKDDGEIIAAKKRLGDAAIIGVSCYNSVERALAAQSLGATYVAFGRFFPSSSKPLAAPADIDTLHKAKAAIHLPIVAIGGILPENGGQLLAAGADLLAVIGGVFDHEPEQSALAYQRLFNE